MSKARGVSNNSTAIFDSLLIVIIVGDFYLFPPIRGYTLWMKSKTNHDRNSKTLWLSILSVITLTLQMRQQSNVIFLGLLRQARFGTLTAEDVRNFHSTMVTILKLDNSLNNIVIVQRNKIRHLISWL